MSDAALILIDFQEQWLDPKSDYFVGDIAKILEKVNRLIQFARKQGLKIIFTRHIEQDSKTDFAPNSKGVEIISLLHKDKKDTLITKYRINPFYQTKLEQELVGVTKVVVAGILTNLCVRSFVEAAYDRDFAITVIADCCVAFDQKTQDFTIQDLKNTREEIQFMDLEEYYAR
ncbi:cysteine hydrolase [Candidatus Beckwithbacteria bacterium]|nr:cysteine hydrolase [Candidatus Beckwithbacteria bacterium]